MDHGSRLNGLWMPQKIEGGDLNESENEKKAFGRFLKHPFYSQEPTFPLNINKFLKLSLLNFKVTILYLEKKLIFRFIQ